MKNKTIPMMNGNDVKKKNGNVLRMERCTSWDTRPHMMTDDGKLSNKKSKIYSPIVTHIQYLITLATVLVYSSTSSAR